MQTSQQDSSPATTPAVDVDPSPGSAWDKTLTRSARRALYGSFSLTVAITLALYFGLAKRVHIEFDDTDYASMQSVIDLQGLVQIDTTSDNGNEAQAARYLAGLLAQEGIEAEIEEFEGNKANLLAILEGQSPELLVLHSHFDTDPIRQPEYWRQDPFGGTLRASYIYGRGVFDMKSTTIAQVHALLRAAAKARESGQRPRRSVAILATSSEETDSKLGAQHVIQTRPQLVERTWAVLGEGGVVEATDWDNIKHWGTSFAQKRYARVRYRSSDKEALETLAEQLREGELGRRFGAVRPNPDAAVFLEHYRETRQHPDIREPLRDLDRVLADSQLFERQPGFIRALFRNELYVFPITEEGPDSSDPETDQRQFVLHLLLHLPPGATVEEAAEELLPTLEETADFEREVEDALGTDQPSPLDHPVFLAIQEEIREHHGDIARGPFYLAYFINDCRFFRSAGLACYGFSPFLLPGGDSATTAGPDERIALRGYIGGVELYADLVDRLIW